MARGASAVQLLPSAIEQARRDNVASLSTTFLYESAAVPNYVIVSLLLPGTGLDDCLYITSLVRRSFLTPFPHQNDGGYSLVFLFSSFVFLLCPTSTLLTQVIPYLCLSRDVS